MTLSDAAYLVRPEDDSLHENDGDLFWNESSWVPFHIADRSLSGIVYFYHRPNMKFTQGGLILWDPSGENAYDCLLYDFDLHALRRLTYIGVTFRTRSRAEVREINRRMRADLWTHLANGGLRLPIDATFPLDRIADALAHMKANRHFGKIVVTI